MPSRFGFDNSTLIQETEEEKCRKYLDQIKGPIIPLVNSILKDFLETKCLDGALRFYREGENDWLVTERNTGIEIIRIAFNCCPGITIRMQKQGLLPLSYPGYSAHLKELASALEKHTCLPVETTDRWY